MERSVEQVRASRNRGRSRESGPCQGNWYFENTKSHESVRDCDRAAQITVRRTSGIMLETQDMSDNIMCAIQ